MNDQAMKDIQNFLSLLKEDIQAIEERLISNIAIEFLFSKTTDIEDEACNLRDYIWDLHSKDRKKSGDPLFQ